MTSDVRTKRVKQTSNDIMGVVYAINPTDSAKIKEMLWSKVKQTINSSFEIDLIYITFDKALCKGFIVVNQNESQDKVKSTIQIDEIDFTIQRAEA